MPGIASLGRTQYYTAATLDGFIADPAHSLEWLFRFGESEADDFPGFIVNVASVTLGAGKPLLPRAINTPPLRLVSAQMLIRRPVAEVFGAFVDPAITTKFRFTKSSGRLEPGKEIRWDWEMYGGSAQVRVKAVEQNRRILIEWGDPPCPVERRFTPRSDHTSVVVN